MTVELAEFEPRDVDRLTEFMAANDWPFHVRPRWTDAQVREAVGSGSFHGEDTRTLWLVVDGVAVGIATISELGDPTALLDLRLAAHARGRRLGTTVLPAVAEWAFTTYPQLHRFEGQTRIDNVAMRRLFVRCGWVKEAHYRVSWPDGDGRLVDSIGYALLRQDWESGTSTPVDWSA